MVPGGARDPLRAQGRRLGIPSGCPAGGGGPGARESAARGRDLSEEATLLTQPPRPYYFVWLTTGYIQGELFE